MIVGAMILKIGYIDHIGDPDDSSGSLVCEICGLYARSGALRP